MWQESNDKNKVIKRRYHGIAFQVLVWSIPFLVRAGGGNGGALLDATELDIEALCLTDQLNRLRLDEAKVKTTSRRHGY